MERTWVEHLYAQYPWQISEKANEFATSNNLIIVGISAYQNKSGDYGAELLVKKAGD